MAKKTISLSALELNDATQMRVRMDNDYIDELAELYKGEVELPPPVVFGVKGAKTYILADGWHRVKGAVKAELLGLEVEVHEGDLADAILYACAANDSHGIRRSTADKRKAITALLNSKRWASRSDRWIADTCKVSPSTVGTLRSQLSTVQLDSRAADPVTGRDGRTYTKPKKADDAVPEPGEEVFPFEKYFASLNGLRKLLDRMYVVHGKVRNDKSVDRDAAYDALSGKLEAIHAAMEKRWLELTGKPFPKQ